MAGLPPGGLLIALLILTPPANAQWGRRLAVAAGPAVVVDDAPPNTGAHLRVSASLLPGIRRLNLLADGYVSWFPAGTQVTQEFAGTFSFRERETQAGVGLSGILGFLQGRSFSPYVLAGGVYRWSDVSRSVVLRDGAGQILQQSAVDFTEDQLDLLLGLGIAIRWGARRVLLEARAYGGTTINLPITVGLSL